MLLLLTLLLVRWLPVTHAAHFIFMSISVRHLRESLVTVFAGVGCLASMHVDVILDVIQLGVGLAAVLAFEQLVWPPGT